MYSGAAAGGRVVADRGTRALESVAATALAALLPAMQAYRTDVADLLVQP